MFVSRPLGEDLLSYPTAVTRLRWVAWFRGCLGLTPLVRFSARGVPYPFHMRARGGGDFPCTFNCLLLGRLDGTCPLGLCPPHRVIPFGTSFNIDALVGHVRDPPACPRKFAPTPIPTTVGPHHIVGCRFRRLGQVLCAERSVGPAIPSRLFTYCRGAPEVPEYVEFIHKCLKREGGPLRVGKVASCLFDC